MKYFLSFLYIIVLYSPAQSRTVDLLLINEAHNYIIFDEFQQRVDIFPIPGWIPFRVIESDYLMGDQISRASKIRWNENAYYLQKDDSGEYLKKGAHGSIIELSSCKVLDDTLQLKEGRRLAYYPSPNFINSDEKLILSDNALIHRLYKAKRYTVFILMDKPSRYYFSPQIWSSAFRVIKNAGPAQTVKIPSTLKEAIYLKFAEVNNSYRDFFEYFSREFSMVPAIPRWDISDSDQSLILSLQGKERFDLSNSMPVLLRQLDQILLGSSFNYTYHSGTITITHEAR